MKLVLVIALAFLALGSTEAKAQWYLPRSQARQETRRVSREVCNEISNCIAWGTGSCLRRGFSRVDCTSALFYPGYYSNEETECNTILHWGVNHWGEVELKNAGKADCFSTYLERK